MWPHRGVRAQVWSRRTAGEAGACGAAHRGGPAAGDQNGNSRGRWTDGVELGKGGISGRAGQAFSVHHSHRALPEKLSLATTTPKKPPTKRTSWNMLKCAYMMVTFLFVSYNRGDWVRRSCYLRGQGGGRGAGRPRGGREWRERRDCQASGGVGEKIPLCKQNRPCLPHSLSLSTTPLHPLPPSWSLDRSHSLLH